MVMLQGFCDESGSDAASKILVVAGLVASQSRWEAFEPDWRLLLASHKIEYFRAKEFYKRNKPFGLRTKWDSQYQRDRFVQQLLQIIQTYSALAVIAIIDLREYQRIFRRRDRVSQRVKSDVGTEYTIAGTGCQWLAGRWAEEQGYQEPIQFYFDSGHKHASEFLTSHNRVLQFPEIVQPHHIGGLNFDDDKKVRPLQAADLLAYGITQSLRRRLDLRDTDAAIKQYVGQKVKYKVVVFGRDSLQRLFDRHETLLRQQHRL